MAKMNSIIEGLKIFAKYADKGLDTYINGADHDIIFGADKSLQISDEDKEQLDKLGWFISSDHDCWSIFC